jgi:plasmid stabilization system protein ParE
MSRRYRVIFDEGAYTDLADIRSFVTAARHAAFAEAFVGEIVNYCESFRTIPHRGSQLIVEGVLLRTVGWRRTVTIAFQVNDELRNVFVLAVLYRGRDVHAALSKRLKD